MHQGVSFIVFLAIAQSWPSFAFLNNRPFPTFSLESMPDTQFSCREKILGGYYADPETQCQMFHVCVKVAGVGVQDFRFLCPNGTAFDQDHQICAEWEDVDCDATTLYYSSDNFDLYRIGSGFESKAVKYGEDEETFALQRAETGDVRINREQQSQRVNQQQSDNNGVYRQSQQRQHRNNNNNERDIFKTSSSSNFFNNRNNGKENDEDYDDNVNVNQNNDYEQKRKLSRKQQRRPSVQTTTTTSQPQRSAAGFSNNFAGSSYIPSTTTTGAPSQRPRVVQRHRISFRAPTTTSSTPPPKQFEDDAPAYSVSTPAPFKHIKQTTSLNYDIPKVKPTKTTENYPSNNPQYNNAKQTTPVTTFAPKPKPFSVAGGLPTTFAPRTNAAYAQITQQTVTNFNKKTSTAQLNPSTFNQQFSSIGTQKPTTTFTQYTPTVPKITATTPVSPVSRSSRFDETQYDDGAYNAKYDYESDEFLKTAHSQNIANSRNELLAKSSTQKFSQPTTTQARTTSRTTSEYPTSASNQQALSKATTTSKPAAPKKAKDVSYDYAYYDSNVNSDPQDYQIDTEIRKSTASA